MVVSKDEIVRSDIIDHAQKLFQQFGLKKTTMDEIAAACGKAKSTLYHYYKSKEEVFEAVIEKEMVSLRKLVKVEVDAEPDLKDKMIRYFSSFHAEVLNKLNLYRVVKQELINEKVSQKHFKRMMTFEQSYLSRILEDAYDSGEFREVDKKDMLWFSEILLAAFLGIVRYSIESEDGFDQEKLKKTVRALIPKVFT